MIFVLVTLNSLGVELCEGVLELLSDGEGVLGLVAVPEVEGVGVAAVVGDGEGLLVRDLLGALGEGLVGRAKGLEEGGDVVGRGLGELAGDGHGECRW